MKGDKKKKIIDSRWDIKRKPDGTVKTRLVCRGFNEEIESKDDIYAAAPSLSTCKLLLNHGLNRNHVMYFGDINAAFLHAPVVQETLVKPPADFISSDGSVVIWKLKKALYGLKSAPKSWQAHLTGQLTEIGLQQLKTDPCLIKHTSEAMFIMVYVDDMFTSG